MAITKISFTHISVEVFSVVLAVLLALGVNEWRESTNNKELAEEAILKIIKEISSNENKLEELVSNHKQIITEIDTVISRLKRREVIAGFGDKQFETPSRTAWDAAVLTTAVNFLDYDQAEKVTSVYSTQKVYCDVSDKVFQELMFLVLERNPEEMVKQFTKQKIYVFNLISVEEQLVEEYSNFLSEFDNKDI